MTLMDAQQYDEARDRRRRHLIIAGVIVALILAWVAYHLRNYPERHAADKFFSALERKDIEGAFGIWYRDPDWKQHTGKYSNYGYGDFNQDWGPSGEWGIIKSHTVNCSYSTSSGVIVQVTVNHRAERAYLWVDKRDKTLHFSPNEVDCGNWWGWLTE
ncbi:MAG TPA: hypothetical protein VFB00_09420 [Terriglobales bacterium]|nr:hypothetical protein [Terriglobales bacterium]